MTMFSTVAAGFKFSEKLGHPTGPGQSNWMAAAYSYVERIMHKRRKILTSNV